jgi:hypothetical protein
MAPQHPLQAPMSMANFPRFSPKPFASFTAPQRPAASAGRKRSRDEAAVNLEADAPPPVSDDWTYGEGMVLIKAGTSYNPDASSQSGTWVDEKLSTAMDSLPKQTVDLNQRIHKSQRRGRDGVSVSPASTPTSESQFRLGSTDATTGSVNGPVVDDFTLQLGIGWRKISPDEHIQAAARGWARYIENHYPVSNARIVLESRGLQSYLVEASEGYFLFDENLRQGRLVSQDSQRALQHLQCSPPTFDGPVTLTAAESPRAMEPTHAAAPVDTEMSIA